MAWSSRPAVWVVGSLVTLVAGIGSAVGAVHEASRLPTIDALPPCGKEFSDDCITERVALVYRDSRSFRGQAPGADKWSLAVDRSAPGLFEGKITLTIPRQHGQDEVFVGARVTLQYVGTKVNWVDTESGQRLTTNEHPRHATEFATVVALFLSPLGLGLLGGGIEARHRTRSWFRQTSMQIVPGAPAALTFGAVGVYAIVRIRGSVLAALLVTIGLAITVWIFWMLEGKRRSRRTPALSRWPRLQRLAQAVSPFKDSGGRHRRR